MSPFLMNRNLSFLYQSHFFPLLCISNSYIQYFTMRYSVIIPVYNRPDEVDELLQSLTAQYFKDFEVVVVEDGSSIPCKEVTDRYIDRLNIKYFSKPNSGPGQTRNYGAERSEGEYLIILDSDVILPERYFDAIEAELLASPADAFGGPDRAHDSFTDIQKAINYSMTSFFTTGGIRGGKRKWINSIPVVSIWGYVGRCMKPWEDSQRCVSARILISASVFLKVVIPVAFFRMPGYITSAGQT